MSDDRLRKLCGDRLRKLREDKHMKTDEIADMLGISRSGYAYYEIGKRTPTSENIVKLANFYGVSSDYILGVSDMSNNEISKDTINNIDAKAEELLQSFLQMPDSSKISIMRWLKSTLDTLNIDPVQLTETQEELVRKYEHLEKESPQRIVQTKAPEPQQTFTVREVARYGQSEEKTLTKEYLDFIKANQETEDSEL